MGSMHTGLEEPGFLGTLDEMAAFYAARAEGGVGLIVTGGISPNASGRVTFGAAKVLPKLPNILLDFFLFIKNF